MALGDVIARLSVSLGLETASFERGARKAQAEAQTLRGTMTKVAGAIGAAFLGAFTVETVNQMRAMTREAVDAVGALGEQAQQLGVTTDALQEFRYVASQTGVEQGEMDKALQRLTRTLGELRDPTKVQAEALKQLGLNAKDLQGLDASQALIVMADAFAKLPDAASRSAVGFDLMGRSFQTLLPLLNEGSAGIRQMITDAREAGIVLTEEQIAKADQAADALTAIEMKTQARLQSLYATNGENLVRFEAQWAELKISLVNAVLGINEGYASIQKASYEFGQDLRATFRAIPGYVSNMVSGVRDAIVGRLNGIWDGVIERVNRVRLAFFDLWDKVTRRSYVPDMVDDIAAEMQRLDGVMVAPVTAATSKAQSAFREMAQNVRGLLDRLFPEVARGLALRDDLALVDKLPEGQREEARRRLYRELAGSDLYGRSGEPPSGLFVDSLDDGNRKVEDGMKRLAERAEATTVRVAKSFKDMADQTLQSLSSLASAVKGGGFLGILEAVVGLGMQLASVGAFGKTIAARVNAPRGYATGTSSAARGLALVGERGPELVNFRGGERVFNNRETRGMMGGGQLEIRPSPLFEVYLDGKLVQAAPAIATAGAQGGVALMNKSASRRWR